VFQRPIKTRPDWPRKLIQTTVHELGHALNLAHRFERPVGRADSISFMNYDWKNLGGMNADRFWREFDFTYPKTDEEERDGQELFRRDVGVFFALGGSDALSDAEDVLDAIVDRRQHRHRSAGGQYSELQSH
jgi:hypothetical protein